MGQEKSYNEKQTYIEKVRPILEEARKACYEAKIPMFTICAVADINGETRYESTMISESLVGRTLSQNKIAKAVNVLNGFDTVPPKKTATLDYDL